ncbi:MAG: hypothetical protein WAU47_01435 [Desulfobaccales bacterium]
MFSQIKRWGGVLVLGGFMILGPGILPAREKGEDKPRFQGSDDHQFAGELRSVGALKFYAETEDLLRSGKFELAFSRYIFLNSHIRGQALYTGLAAMVNQRLNFLRSQMGLGDMPHYVHVEPEQRTRARRAPPCPPPAKKADKKPAADAEEKTPEIVIPPTVAAGEEKAPPPDEKKSPDEKKPPKKAAPEAAPPPGIWEKIKSKLKFW